MLPASRPTRPASVPSSGTRRRDLRLWLAGIAVVVVALVIGRGVGIVGSPVAAPSAVASGAPDPSVPVTAGGAVLSPTESPGGPAVPSDAASGTASPPPVAAPIASPTASPTNVYAGTGVGMLSPVVAAFPPRVYVPDEASGTVSVIDPRTYRIVARYAVGASPEHITPDWDLRRLYVESTFSGRLAIIDPATGRLIGRRDVPPPYNLYFSLDGRWAIDVVDRSGVGGEFRRSAQLYFYDRRTWRLKKALIIPWAGADHLDFTADGRYAILSTEYSGFLVKVDVERMTVVTALFLGGSPTDVRLAPDGRVVYVANQGRNGVSIVDPATMRQVAFVPTGRGAHGLAISRDARSLYVTNRLAGTLSVIDFATRRVVSSWRIGGSPDMISVSPDGTRLWISNRFSGTVSVVDPRTGRVVRTIRTGGRPHGLMYYPQPGSLSLGHNGNNR
ncbi:MAG: beta-propeller fold lactonase family protein [Chloroflexi bacterium]|nr:beta-propeller fold lactonase family protein [Chloroflexota bacterium]